MADPAWPENQALVMTSNALASVDPATGELHTVCALPVEDAPAEAHFLWGRRVVVYISESARAIVLVRLAGCDVRPLLGWDHVTLPICDVGDTTRIADLTPATIDTVDADTPSALTVDISEERLCLKLAARATDTHRAMVSIDLNSPTSATARWMPESCEAEYSISTAHEAADFNCEAREAGPRLLVEHHGQGAYYELGYIEDEDGNGLSILQHNDGDGNTMQHGTPMVGGGDPETCAVYCNWDELSESPDGEWVLVYGAREPQAWRVALMQRSTGSFYPLQPKPWPSEGTGTWPWPRAIPTRDLVRAPEITYLAASHEEPTWIGPHAVVFSGNLTVAGEFQLALPARQVEPF